MPNAITTPPPSSEPPCHCPTSTPWDDRIVNGPYVVEGQLVGEMRTCRVCVATMTREVSS